MKQNEEFFPQFNCPNCGNTIQLKFMPKKKPSKLDNLICPVCGYVNDRRELKD